MLSGSRNNQPTSLRCYTGSVPIRQFDFSKRSQGQTNQRSSLWTPHPDNRPQQDAYRLADEVDELGYGGAAGGGKTDLAEGLAATKHKRSLILRREFTQLRAIIDRSREIIGEQGRFNEGKSVWRDLPGGRQIEFGGCKDENDKKNYQGQPHDLIVFDEATEFLRSQRDFIIGWARSTDPNQHVVVLYTFNPPTTPEGAWIVELFAPWLDPEHANPAAPGEVRYFAVIDGAEVEVDGPDVFEHDGETIKPKSRTFIPARVDDNPYWQGTNYKAQLQSLPEPLRSQMLYGDFGAGQEDDPWQVIPTAWIRAAQERWRNGPRPDQDKKPDALGVDVARGGKDKTVIAPRYGHWFDVLQKHPGTATPDGPHVAALVQAQMHSGITVSIDVIGCGGSPFDILRTFADAHTAVYGVNGAEASEATDRSGKLGFVNLRAEYYWKLREALDPDSGMDIAIPPDTELLADLCSARWKLTVRGIQIEAKDDIIKRIGRSPDCGDAIVYAFNAVAGVASISTGSRKRETTKWQKM